VEKGHESWRTADWSALTVIDQRRLHETAVVLHSLDSFLTGESWHLKGSTAVLGWTGPTARLPQDIDLSMSRAAGLRLLQASALPAGPHGEQVRLLRSEPVVFHTPGKAAVHRASIEMRDADGWDRALLNVLLVPDDASPDQRTAMISFPVTALPAVTVPAATLSRCLAQKLLRYARLRGEGKVNTRWTDLTDFLLAAASTRAPALGLDEVRRDVAVEFAAMGRAWPMRLPPPPAEWLDFWDTAVFRDGHVFGPLAAAVERVERFWDPVLTRSVALTTTPPPMPSSLTWSPHSWTWAST
jgi:hypothetical protein